MRGPPHQFTGRCAIKPRIAGEFRRSAQQDPHHEPIIRNFKSNPPIDAQKAWSSTALAFFQPPALGHAALRRFTRKPGITKQPMLTADILEFKVPFRRTVLVGNRWTPPAATRTALLLHGGGTSAADGFVELRTFLYAKGIETLAFDCIGHGRTGGQLLGSTLHDRVLQVQAVVKSQGIVPSTLTLAGFSMGAYVVVKAAVEIGVPRLCLAIPAAYAAQAYEVPFGPEFSQVLRTPRSWANSDAFEITRDYTGHLLVISAQDDQIVPAEIPQRYAPISGTRASTVHHIVKRSGHNLSEHYEREPQARTAAYTEIALLCQRGDAWAAHKHQ